MAFSYTSARYNVIGKLRQNLYAGVAFSSGDTFTVGLNSIVQAVLDEVAASTNVTYTVANSTPAPGQSQITFNTNGGPAVSGINLQLIGN